MDWSHKNSIILTKICIILFGIAYIATVLACPVIVREYVAVSYTAKDLIPGLFMATIYICAAPVGILLWKLWGLVVNIGEEKVFTEENIRRLRIISWMCFAVAAVTLASVWYYLFWGIAAGLMVFMGLLIRVIKNTFEKAKELKDENDFTI